MNTKHTPGPWTNSGQNLTYGPDAYFDIDGGGKRIAGVNVLQTFGSNRALPGVDEAAANAKLIAAAPEMAETLRAIAAKIDAASGSPHFTADEHDALLALLAKAGL